MTLSTSPQPALRNIVILSRRYSLLSYCTVQRSDLPSWKLLCTVQRRDGDPSAPFSTTSTINIKKASQATLHLTTREAAWYIILVVSICLSVCLYVCMSVCQTITFESFDVGSSYLRMRCIPTDYGSSSYMKVIWSRSRSQEPKR